MEVTNMKKMLMITLITSGLYAYQTPELNEIKKSVEQERLLCFKEGKKSPATCELDVQKRLNTLQNIDDNNIRLAATEKANKERAIASKKPPMRLQKDRGVNLLDKCISDAKSKEDISKCYSVVKETKQ
jgi:hypothetical protein